MNTAKCRSCGAEIIWAIHDVSGKRMPMDAVPMTVRGAFRLLERPTNGVVDALPSGPLYQSHFATCPNAAQHRRS